ncbi:endo-1,4-beta-xylanase [Saonia flava]|uniref:Beta-xylanase n=1 Tax=Saonia flava TaxID=523696 RepID=A0A846QW70_9FLAO|nr:endo-1,4-beta-xylanase [Saonia flava]NJB72238.1 endo-1,4-beta-xylanase [Saonia flava]
MKTGKILMLCISFVFFSCSSGDDTPPPMIGGPTQGGTGGESTGGETGGGSTGGTTDPLLYDATENLKDVAEFPIGNVISAARLAGTSDNDVARKDILNTEYNSITAENDMKMANIFTAADTYDFSDGDAIVAYAKANGLRVHGHALIWHSSIPGWLNSFSGTDEEFETLVENYVKATVAHFAEEKDTDGNSIVASWDVVNEYFDGGTIRSSIFSQRIGDDFMDKAFAWAREADADVKLFYNDYNIAGEVGKRSQIINKVNEMITNNVPIDGIGMQMHLNHNWPNTDLPTAIQEISDTGLLVHVSELDVKANYNDDVTELTQERAEEQENQYQRAGYYYTAIVPVAQQFGITVWGFRDTESWLYDGGGDWPLLYDGEFMTKISHRGLINGLDGEDPGN